MSFFQLAIVIIFPLSIASLRIQQNFTAPAQNFTAPAVFDLIRSNSQLSILNSLIDIIPDFRRGISNGNFTFLAPTDTALSSFNESNPDDFQILVSDHWFLTDFLQSMYYFLNSRFGYPQHTHDP